MTEQAQRILLRTFARTKVEGNCQFGVFDLPRLQGDLKKEIKKLQRLRDTVKTWLQVGSRTARYLISGSSTISFAVTWPNRNAEHKADMTIAASSSVVLCFVLTRLSNGSRARSRTRRT